MKVFPPQTYNTCDKIRSLHKQIFIVQFVVYILQCAYYKISAVNSVIGPDNLIKKIQGPSLVVQDLPWMWQIAAGLRQPWSLLKIDGVGPVDNRPSTDKLLHFVPKKKKKIVTCDTWHVTRDTWHVTWRDTWHMTCDMFGGGWTFSQNFSSLALTVCDLWYYEYLEEKDDSIN